MWKHEKKKFIHFDREFVLAYEIAIYLLLHIIILRKYAPLFLGYFHHSTIDDICKY